MNPQDGNEYIPEDKVSRNCDPGPQPGFSAATAGVRPNRTRRDNQQKHTEHKPPYIQDFQLGALDDDSIYSRVSGGHIFLIYVI
jgi:hypothetical protein